MKVFDYLSRAATVLRDLYMGSIPLPDQAQYINSLLPSLVGYLRDQGIDDMGAWDTPATAEISVGAKGRRERHRHLLEQMKAEGLTVQFCLNVLDEQPAFAPAFQGNRRPFKFGRDGVRINGVRHLDLTVDSTMNDAQMTAAEQTTNDRFEQALEYSERSFGPSDQRRYELFVEAFVDATIKPCCTVDDRAAA